MGIKNGDIGPREMDPQFKTGCFSRGPRLSPQNPRDGSQLSVLQFQEIRCLSYPMRHQASMRCIDTHPGKLLIHTK